MSASDDQLKTEQPTVRATQLGLSGKLLLLTIPLALIALLMIYVPAIANFRMNRLNDRIAAANTAVAATEDFTMAGNCETGESAIELIPDGSAGIVLMDINMPGMGGIEATRRLRAAHPELIVLLTSTYDVEDLPPDVASCGAAAYLHKEHLTPSLLTRLWKASQ